MQLYIKELPPLNDTNNRASHEREATLLLLRQALGPYVEYSHHPSGAPRAVTGQSEHLISVSHSRAAVALAIADDETALGIDIEAPREQLYRIRHKFLTTGELPLFTSLHDLLKAWTAKEAVYKAALTPGLALHEIDCRCLSEGIVTARGITYTLTYPIDTPGQVLAAATR